MRKLLLTTAALAALSFGAAHAAPTVAIGADIQLNVAPQAAQTNLGGVNVNHDLTSSTQAIGNDFSVSNANNHGIAVGLEIQTNNGAQTAVTNVFGDTVTNVADISTTAVGNAVSVEATKGLALNAGLQINAAPQVAVTNIGVNSFQGKTTVSTAAVGNDISVTGKYAVNLSAQGNFAPQFAETNIGGTAGVAAIPDTTTTTSHTTYFFGFPVSTTSVTVNNHDGSPAVPAHLVSFTDLSVSTDAIGNIASTDGTKFAGQLSVQGNFAPQAAVTNISLANVSHDLTVSTVAAGNVANVSVK